jgi:competence protein ComEC
LNISIVIAMFLSLGALLFGRQRSLYIWLALAFTWLYTLLAGMNPPVIRAAIMGSLFLIAVYLGRQGSAIIALAFAAAVMVGIQPQLLWSVSFQLSFLAMAGLILLYPYFQAWGRKGVALLFKNREKILPTASIITDGFAASLAAIVAVGPLIAYNFGIVSLVALPANLLLPARLARYHSHNSPGCLRGTLRPAHGSNNWLAGLAFSQLFRFSSSRL